MIVLVAALAGAILGGFIAKRRDGKVADIAQYATSFAIAFAIVGLVVTIIIHRSVV